jgi:hypothetical protein
MADQKKSPGEWLKGGGVTIADDVILLELKLTGGAEFLGGLLARKIAVALASKRQIELSQEDLDAALNEFYAERELFEDAQIAEWFNSIRVKEDSVREYVREIALLARARTILVTDDAVNDRFASERYDHSLAEVEVSAFASAGKAKEFMLAVREKEAAPAGGEPRQVTRREAPEEIAATLFSCDPGDLVGPVENDEGEFEVFILRSRSEVELDDELREKIRGEMFRQLIEAELARAPVKYLE